MPRAFASRFAAFAAVAAGGFMALPVSAQEPGSLDRAYTPAAVSITNLSAKSAASVRALAVQGDGKTVVAGSDAEGRPMLLRLKADGRAERNFVASRPNDTVHAVALTPKGQIMVAGSFTGFSDKDAKVTPQTRVARLNPNGGLDASFRSGAGANGTVRAMTVQKDGRVLIGGAFSEYDGKSRNRLARLEADGSIDASFSPESSADGAVDAIAVQEADGSVLAAGSFALNGGSTRARIVRLRANGGLDSTFSTTSNIDGRVRSIVVQKDGRIVIGGDFSKVDGVSRHGIARLNANGGLDASFDSGEGVDGSVFAVAVHAKDGRVVIAGSFGMVDGVARSGVARLQADGRIDRTFSSGAGTNGLVRAAAIAGGKLTIGGDFTVVDGAVRGAIARLNTQSPLKPVVHGRTSANRGPITKAANDPIIQFGAAAFVASENTGFATIVVTRTGDTTAGAAVDYATSDGTAIDGTDYTSTSGTLTFDPGDAGPIFFDIPLAVDGIQEPDETVNITLSAPTGAAFANAAATLTTTLTITDDAPTFLQLSSATYSASEAAGQAVITVNRTGGSNRAVSVYYETSSGGTATDFDDYTPVFGQLFWAAGDFTPKTFTIPIVIDSEPEADETVFVDIGVSNGPAVVGPRVEATLTIADIASSTLQFSGPNFTAREVTGFATIVVTRSGGDGSPVSVAYTTTPGDALGADNFNDFDPMSNPNGNPNADFINLMGTVSWAQNDFGPKTISVVLNTNDQTPEPDESFLVQLTGVTGNAVVGTQDQTTVTITESTPSTINFSGTNTTDGNGNVTATSFLASESQGTVLITATRTGGGFGPASVDYSVTSGTATAGLDFTAVSGTLNWAAGDFSPKTFPVPIIKDSISEQDELAILTLSNPGGLAILGALSQSTLKITDGPPASVQFVTTASSVNENAGSATITVTRTGSGLGAVSVDYAAIDGTAMAGADYTSVAGTITFPDGDFTPQSITVPILSDTLDEPTETLSIKLSNVVGEAVIGKQSTLVLSIVNTPTTSLQFSSATYTTSENSPQGVVISVERTGDLSSAVSVDYTTSDGTATAGTDYTAASGTLTWGVGDSLPKTFLVPILPDNITEPAETVQLSLTRPVGPVLLGTLAMSTLTITDNAAATLQFTQASYTGAEAPPQGSITVAVTRIGNTAGAVSVNYSLVPGTASALTDYIDISGTLTWADGDASPKTFVVTLDNDDLPESPETLTAVLSSPTGSSVLGSLNRATLTINDDDAAPVLQFSSATYNVNENSASAVLTVTRSGSNLGAVSVDYVSIVGGTATPGADYQSVIGTLNWAAGDVAPKSFLVPIVNDSVMEGSETVLFNLSNATGNATVGAQGQSTLTIVDDDQPSTVQFSAATYNAPSGAVSAIITVTRAGGSGSAISVNYSTADGTATAGVDYAATSGTLNFGVGDVTAKSFVVPILNSTAALGTKAFSVVLSDPTGGAGLGVTNQAAVTINGATTNVVTVTAKQPEVSEGEGKGKFVISRSGDLSSDLLVRFITKGAAIKNSDYVGFGKKVVIPAGASSVKVKFATIADGKHEGDEKVKLVLVAGDGYTIGSPAVATITILDAD